MATRAITEYDGKRMLAKYLAEASAGAHGVAFRGVRVTRADLTASSPAALERLREDNAWVETTKLVVKPDQLIKRRGKHGLVGLNLTWEQALEWAKARAGAKITIDSVQGELDTFIIEPFVPHQDKDEVYLSIQNSREGESILFYHEGGVDIGDVDAKAEKWDVTLSQEELGLDEIKSKLLSKVEDEVAKARLSTYIRALHHVYRELHFSLMEINPIVLVPGATSADAMECVAVDLAAKLDECAEFLVGSKWGDVTFPAPFGRPLLPAETRVHDLDEKTGASLKLTILNPQGRVWTMVAGGGASVVYADTVTDLGFSKELANYGEYSGDPSEDLTYEYARALLGVMTEHEDPRGKVLIVGGGIANFTNVKATFNGIVRAFREYGPKMVRGGIKIWVRRGGPNYQAGLKMMKDVGAEIGVPMAVFGPETNIVAIVPMALGLIATPAENTVLPVASPPTVSSSASPSASPPDSPKKTPAPEESAGNAPASRNGDTAKGVEAMKELNSSGLFNESTRAIVYGLQITAVQGMLDFDHICGRATPSVAAIVFPFGGDHLQKFYYGPNETMVPVFKDMSTAVRKNPTATVLINFASFRSAYTTTMEALTYSSQLKVFAIIAEGIPEQQTRKINREAAKRNVTIIGPATVGAIRPGCLRIGNTGGQIDNLIQAKLYRPGSVAYVSKSGGMSNELNNIISRHADGVREGVAIGGDRYPGTRFADHIKRYQADPAVKVIVMLGEVGGTDEYEIAQGLADGSITKPIVAWCIGTCAARFGFEVQFGHAGALASKERETALAKNQALRDAGAHVPESFATIGETLEQVFKSLNVPKLVEPPVPSVPMDFAWAKRLGIVRKPAAFVSTISDDRGDELVYAGMPISKVVEEGLGIGGVIGLLWFKRRLPEYVSRFIELILVLTADHGPAVSGAHNTIVCARAGKGLVESLVSGLLTVGPRFGGALDESAKMFTKASDRNVPPKEWVNECKNQNILIMGIGHRVKSASNPDKRVQLIVEFAHNNFPSTPILDFALEVEKITTKKKSNLILNVDGAVACAFVDMMRGCGAFSREEADEAVELGTLNGLFVVGRSVGFIGHFLDQTRMKQPLYRHPVDDIAYNLPVMGDESETLFRM